MSPRSPVVLKIHAVRQGGHHYYVQDLVPGRAEGGLVAGEEPGQWLGAGAAALGLSGRVVPEPFAEVLEGRDPRSGRDLRRSQGERSVAGFDLTFCAPKSVSILHLLAPAELGAAVDTGHRVAVADALAFMGQAALGVRRRSGGQVDLVAATGPVASTFVHRTSRALDPHLHTHVVVANVAQGVDGRWSSIDSRRLYAHIAAIQALYHARLRLELSERIGARWEVRSSGMGDVIGVDRTLRRIFSGRAASIDEHRHRHDDRRERPGGAAAFFADRPEKDTRITVERLRHAWRGRAGEFGYELGDLTRVIGAHRRQEAPVVDEVRLRERLGQLARGRLPPDRSGLVAAVASSIPTGAVGRHVVAVTDGILEATGGGRGLSLPDRPGPIGPGVLGGLGAHAVESRRQDRFPAGGEPRDPIGSVGGTNRAPPARWTTTEGRTSLLGERGEDPDRGVELPGVRSPALGRDLGFGLEL